MPAAETHIVPIGSEEIQATAVDSSSRLGVRQRLLDGALAASLLIPGLAGCGGGTNAEAESPPDTPAAGPAGLETPSTKGSIDPPPPKPKDLEEVAAAIPCYEFGHPFEKAYGPEIDAAGIPEEDKKVFREIFDLYGTCVVEPDYLERIAEEEDITVVHLFNWEDQAPCDISEPDSSGSADEWTAVGDLEEGDQWTAFAEYVREEDGATTDEDTPAEDEETRLVDEETYWEIVENTNASDVVQVGNLPECPDDSVLDWFNSIADRREGAVDPPPVPPPSETAVEEDDEFGGDGVPPEVYEEYEGYKTSDDTTASTTAEMPANLPEGTVFEQDGKKYVIFDGEPVPLEP